MILRMVLFLCRELSREYISTANRKLLLALQKVKVLFALFLFPTLCLTILKAQRKSDDFYIITGTCKPTEPRTMQNRFNAILNSCNIRNVNFHLLRHTYATVCIENGFDPKTLSELLGHADASITLNRYVHSSMLMKKELC